MHGMRHNLILVVDPSDAVAGAPPAQWAAKELEDSLGAIRARDHPNVQRSMRMAARREEAGRSSGDVMGRTLTIKVGAETILLDVETDGGSQQGMMGVSLDDLTGRFGLPFPNHIKIDVDGIEDLIVRGASKTLDGPALRTVLVEVYLYKSVAEEIQEAFLRHGFALHNAAAIDWKPGTARNLIFVR